jgi:transcriptional regulator EpsA
MSTIKEVEQLDEDLPQLFSLILQLIDVGRHVDLMRWLHGDFQRYLHHDILIAAWGNFSLGVVHYDVISDMPGVRTESAMAESVSPLLTSLFTRWMSQGHAPFSLSVGESGFTWDRVVDNGPIAESLGTMRSCLVHGIRDERGRHDCLYIFFSKHLVRSSKERSACRFFLPYIDTALRQVELLPDQYPPLPVARAAIAPAVVEKLAPDTANTALSERESEIMVWIAKGKTNGEIGSILNVSEFTVKNHLQRIFKKLCVSNRAQAVAMYTA